MFRALYTAASGMSAQQMNLDNVANNLANSSTAGFRKRRLQFQDLMSECHCPRQRRHPADDHRCRTPDRPRYALRRL